MEFRKPTVLIIGSSEVDYDGMVEYFHQMGADAWYEENVEDPCMRAEFTHGNHVHVDGQVLSEVYSRSCYKSFGVGLNPNITKVREGNAEHLKNVIESGHGSVLEHCMVNFMFTDVSRVFTHELVRHRVGVAISQESLRYVRLTKLMSFDFPPSGELSDEDEMWFREVTREVFEYLENIQQRMSDRFGLDDEKSFAKKKKLTSRMRRLAPLGLLTNIGWSANLRTLRHIIPLRTHKSAEEEIRHVFADVGLQCVDRYPNVFFDMVWCPDDGGNVFGLGEWQIKNKKV